MTETKYYDGTKLLSLTDINGDKPEIYMCTTNRTGGKTTYFGRMFVNKFLKEGSKFALLYRYNYELDDVADKFFKDIKTLFFPNWEMKSERQAKGIFHTIYLADVSKDPDAWVHCGYAISLNSSDQIKKYSHLFSDVDRILFDEFQSETNHYCSDELTKFISVHTSIARGQGKQTRYVPVYMLSNPVSLINPYYTEMGISGRLRDDTKFLKGEGFVLEQGFIETASRALKESAFNRAFSKHSYVAYAAECVYLNDSKTFIEKPEGRSRYLGTLKYNGTEYGIREFAEQNIIYCDNRPDVTFAYKLCVTTDDHDVNYVMLKRNDIFIANMRMFFERGCFRFKDLKCKEAIMTMISY